MSLSNAKVSAFITPNPLQARPAPRSGKRTTLTVKVPRSLKEGIVRTAERQARLGVMNVDMTQRTNASDQASRAIDAFLSDGSCVSEVAMRKASSEESVKFNFSLPPRLLERITWTAEAATALRSGLPGCQAAKVTATDVVCCALGRYLSGAR